MPPRINPTARNERLGTELRKLREQAGMTARAAASLLGADQAQMSNLEAGRVGASAERVRRLAAHYACDDTALVDALVEMATERTRGWWEEYREVLPRNFLDLSELEFHATAMRTVKVVEIPGIMQTEAHARAVFGYYPPPLPPRDLEARVAHRMQRRTVLDRAHPPLVEAVVHEAALHMTVGGPRTAREQLGLLLELSDRPNISVRVIPFSAGEFAGPGVSMLYLDGPVRQLDTVQVDTPLNGVLMNAEAQLRRYRTLYAKVVGASLGVAASRDLIHRLAKDL
ncbi:helix-turn-helix domain-containing protein [Kitasatospora sp. NBC_00315]|uniref:helix-turn-helix domain-containing protein n=1 Tax=Kitasatospora sp. NBC_00315 TaxID=2975963 RepID=UPI00324B6C95